MKIIGIHSVPRSGSTWLGEILNSHVNVAYRFQPMFSHAYKNRIDSDSSIEQINLFFNDILKSSDEFLLQTGKREIGTLPTFKKKDIHFIVYKEVRYHYLIKNLIEKSEDIKILGLIRNPFSVLNSWFNANREFRIDLGWRINDEWKSAPKKNLNKREEYFGYEKWKELCYYFLELSMNSSKQFYLVNYDNLLTDTTNEVNRIFKFSGLSLGEQTVSFLDSSRSVNSNDSYSVFKIKKEDRYSRGNMPYSIEQEILSDPEFIELNSYFRWI